MIRKRYYQQRETERKVVEERKVDGERERMSLKIGAITLWYGDNIACGIQSLYILQYELPADTKSWIKIECNYHTLYINIHQCSLCSWYTKCSYHAHNWRRKKRAISIYVSKISVIQFLQYWIASVNGKDYLLSFIFLLSFYLATVYFPFRLSSQN